jgi:8-oxo-dGTP diphosphatase
MKQLKEIYFGEKPFEISDWDCRKSARGIVMDQEGKIGLLYAKTFALPKLPGGGVEEGEDLREAFKRECKEELGCEVEIVGEVGSILEYREVRKMTNESFCFLARVVGEKGEPTFTVKELNEGLEILWVPIREALELFKTDLPDEYEPKFIQVREKTFLEKAQKQL